MVLLRLIFDDFRLLMNRKLGLLLTFLELRVISLRLFGYESFKNTVYFLHSDHLVLFHRIGNALMELAFLERILSLVQILLVLD